MLACTIARIMFSTRDQPTSCSVYSRDVAWWVIQGHQYSRLCGMLTKGSTCRCESRGCLDFATMGFQWLSSYYKLCDRGTLLAFFEGRHRNNFNWQLVSSRILGTWWLHMSLCRACRVLHPSNRGSSFRGSQYPSSEVAASLTRKYKNRSWDESIVWLSWHVSSGEGAYT